MTDDELIDYMTKRIEKRLYAGGVFKGLPEDKHFEELEVARIVFEHLGLPVKSLMSQPHGPNTAPDVGIILQSGERIGLEVTELVDGPLRKRHAIRRAAENKKGLSEKDVFDAIVQTGLDPIPADDVIPPFGATRVWDEQEIAAKLDERMECKDTNTHLQDHASEYDAIWLAVFTGEPHINDFPDLVERAVAHLTYRPIIIRRVFVVFDYRPGHSGSGHPVIELGQR